MQDGGRKSGRVDSLSEWSGRHTPIPRHAQPLRPVYSVVELADRLEQRPYRGVSRVIKCDEHSLLLLRRLEVSYSSLFKQAELAADIPHIIEQVLVNRHNELLHHQLIVYVLNVSQ